MTGNSLMAVLFTAFIGLIVTAIALVLLSGHGGSMIAGYNTASEAEKRKYDEKALCRFVGKILLPIGLCMPAVALGGAYHIAWLPAAYAVMTVSLVIFAVVWLNTGNRYKR